MNASQPDSGDDSSFDAAAADAPPPGPAHFDPPTHDGGRETFVMPPAHDAPAPESPGRRLRTAREARGLDLEQAASRLRLPQRLLQALEADDYSRIEHGVYLRGYLTSYARLVGLPETEFAHCAESEKKAPPPLIATGQISHSRYLYQRYSVPAVYVLLTGLIVGPSVWLATHGGLERNLAHISALETPPPADNPPGATPTASVPLPSDRIAQSGAAPESVVDGVAVPPVEEPAAPSSASSRPKPADQPLMASLAPFPNLPATPASEPAAAGNGVHRLHLKLSEASWVEISADDGRKLEFGILPAGSERDYVANGALSVRLGNTSGASVALDGKAVDLAPYRRSNVAYFRAFGAKGDIAPVEN